MKITDSKVVQSGEKAFLNAVKDYLDWNAIREVVTKKMRQCAIESKGGELVLHENSVAFRMDLHCTMDVSITFDREGTLVSDEEPLAGLAMNEKTVADSDGAGQVVSTPPSGKKRDKKQSVKPAPRPAVAEKSEDLDDNDDVLELNELLEDFQSDDDVSPSSHKESAQSDEDDDMDLEALFFKDKVDDDDDPDAVADDAGAFWEDKK